MNHTLKVVLMVKCICVLLVFEETKKEDLTAVSSNLVVPKKVKHGME